MNISSTDSVDIEKQDEPSVSDRQHSNWDIRNAPKNYLSLVFAQVGTASFSLAAVWLLTRYLGADGYGGVVAILLAGQLAQIPVIWTGNALSRFGVQEFVETGKISKAFWGRTFILVPNLILMVALSPLWMTPLAGWLKIPPALFPLVLINISVIALSMHVQAALQGAKLIQLQSILTVTERLSILVTLIVLALSGSISLPLTIWAYIVPPFIIAVIGLWKLRPVLSGIVLERAILKKIIVFSLPIPLYSALSHLTFNHLDAIFILRYLSAADLGIYSVAYQLNGWVIQLSVLVGFVMMPLFVTSQAHDKAELKRTYFRDILPLVTFTFSMFSVTLAVSGYFFLPLLFNETFVQVGSLLIMFAASCSFAVPVQAGFLPLAYSTSKTFIQLIAAVVGAGLNIGFDILLIPRYGLAGCVWATIISYTFNMLIFAMLIGRNFDLPYVSTLFATVPALIGASVFAWTNNVALSVLATAAVGSIFLLFNRKALFNGYQKLLTYRPNW